MERCWIITDSASSFTAADFLIPGTELGLDDRAYCRKRTLHGGRQEGVELIELSNGVVTVRVCPTRGMGIIDGSVGPIALGWRSPVREIVHPAYINLLEMGGRGAHYGFNELLNRGGIEWSGAMGDDEVVNNRGERERVFLPLHGKVGWTPASAVRLVAAGGNVTLEGDVPEQLVFGVSYLLRTRLTLAAGGARILVEDRLCNLGDSDGEYELLYHTNFGPPILGRGSRFVAGWDRLVPRDRFAAEGLAALSELPAPTPGFVEQVFLFRPCADSDGWAHLLVESPDRTAAAEVSFAASTLPYAILWKRCAGLRDGYVVGLNPCSDLPNPRLLERREGRLARLAAGAEVSFFEAIDVHLGESRVREAVERIEAAPGAREIGPAGEFRFLDAR